MKIHFESKTIVISKAFANKASHFGSPEYMLLRNASHDLPDFAVVVKAPQKGNRSCTAGLMYAYTESLPERNNFAA